MASPCLSKPAASPTGFEKCLPQSCITRNDQQNEPRYVQANATHVEAEDVLLISLDVDWRETAGQDPDGDFVGFFWVVLGPCVQKRYYEPSATFEGSASRSSSSSGRSSAPVDASTAVIGIDCEQTTEDETSGSPGSALELLRGSLLCEQCPPLALLESSFCCTGLLQEVAAMYAA